MAAMVDSADLLTYEKFIAQAQLIKIAKRLKADIGPEDLQQLFKEAGIG